MPYVGRENITGEFIKLDAITTSATNTFNLQRNGAAFAPGTTEQCIVSVNGVTQAPQDAFNISGSQIVFTETLSGNDVIAYSCKPSLGFFLWQISPIARDKFKLPSILPSIFTVDPAL